MKVKKGYHKVRDEDATSFMRNSFSCNSEKTEFTSVTFLTETLIFFTSNLVKTSW